MPLLASGGQPLELTTASPRTRLFDLFITWLSLGAQSFGGGTSTLTLIHRTCIRKGWLVEEEFVRDWALAQISPGINLIKLTILVGHKLRGWPGILFAVAGLLLPSGLVTVLMTAGYSAIRDQPLVAAAMRGILPATIGLSLAMSIQMARPIARRARHEGPARLLTHLLILTAAAVLMGSGAVSPVLLILGTGGVTMLALRVVPARPDGVEGNGSDQPV